MKYNSVKNFKFKFILLFIINMRLTCALLMKAASTFNVLKHSIIFDKKMPRLYINNNFDVDDELKSSIYSMEHIFPRSLIKKEHVNDMHNIARTINNLNMKRSNYKFINKYDINENWEKLEFQNFVNHKKKLFVPNESSRGFIARAILYMCKEYKYKCNKVIDKDILYNWYIDNPPTELEIYHNNLVRRVQNTDNIFISKYNCRKKSSVVKFFDLL